MLVNGIITTLWWQRNETLIHEGRSVQLYPAQSKHNTEEDRNLPVTSLRVKRGKRRGSTRRRLLILSHKEKKSRFNAFGGGWENLRWRDRANFPRSCFDFCLKNNSDHGEKVWFPFQTVTHRGQRSGKNVSDHSFCWGQFQLYVHFHHRYV